MSKTTRPAVSGDGDACDALLQSLGKPAIRVTFAEALSWSRGRQIRDHIHDDLWQLDLFKGHLTVRVEDRLLALTDWTLLLIPAGTRHAFLHDTSQPLRSIGFKFRSAGQPLHRLPPMHLTSADHGLRRRSEDRLIQILEEWQLALPGREHLLSMLATTAIVDLVRQWQQQHAQPQHSSPLQHACRFIAVNYSRSITIAEVAREVGVRPDYLCRLFRTRLNTTPSRYLLECRLRQAQVLLQAGHRVGECAHLTGFTSLHYFSRAFKRRYGTSPTLWIRDRAG